LLETPLKEPSLAGLPEPSPAPRPIRFAASVLLVLAAIAWCIVCTYRFYHRDWNSEATGYCFGTLLLPLLVAYAIAGAKRRRNGLWFALWFFGFTILGTAYIWTQSRNGLADLPPPEMIRTMTGTMPLPADASENDRQTVAATKQFFADLLEINSSYNQKQAALTPDLNKIYTAAAFTDRAAIQHMQGIVQQKLALDEDTASKIRQAPEQLRALLQKSALSEAQRQDFMRGVESQFNGSEIMKARGEMLAAEEKWAATTNDLYDYALQHSSQIKVTNASIGIGSPAVREEFNTRFTRAKQQRDAFNASTRKLQETRQAAMNSSGVTPKDLGLTK
jgi:hypothetical protein